MRSHRTCRTISGRKQKKVVDRACQDGPLRPNSYIKQYITCIRPKAIAADKSIQQFILGDSSGSDSDYVNINYGPVYASLPVLRVTMLWEPFSWLKSKFFWMDYHLLNGNNSTIGNSLALADMGEGINNRKRSNWDDKKKGNVQGCHLRPVRR